MGKINDGLGELLGKLDATAEVPEGASKADIIAMIADATEGGGGGGSKVTAYRIDLELAITSGTSATVSSTDMHDVAVTEIATALRDQPERTNVVITLATSDGSYPIVCCPAISPKVMGQYTLLTTRILGAYENSGGDTQVIDATVSIDASGGHVLSFSRKEI